MDRKILLNVAQCKKCKDVIVSRTTHDFRVCSCGNLAVDGGNSYLKRSFKTKDWTELSIYKDENSETLLFP